MWHMKKTRTSMISLDCYPTSVTFSLTLKCGFMPSPLNPQPLIWGLELSLSSGSTQLIWWTLVSENLKLKMCKIVCYLTLDQQEALYFEFLMMFDLSFFVSLEVQTFEVTHNLVLAGIILKVLCPGVPIASGWARLFLVQTFIEFFLCIYFERFSYWSFKNHKI